jgi:predicted XRE-type DNA-binding protein
MPRRFSFSGYLYSDILPPMSVAALEQQILQAIREWMAAEHLTQEEAAGRLGMNQANLSGLLKGRRRQSLNVLLRDWEASGGRCELRLSREGALRAPCDKP